MENPLATLNEQHPSRVTAALNVLMEAPYFYRDDHEETFFFIRRHKQELARFFEQYFGWSLVVDDKCARVHKEKWHNPAIPESQRDVFGFRRRDECLAFMMLLEFFEHQMDQNSMTVEDRDNLRFRLGDLLAFLTRRFAELYPDLAAERYTEERVRKDILRSMMPVLERYRFVRKVPPPKEMSKVAEAEIIYEALPALYHYNSQRLYQSIQASEPDTDDAEGN